MFRRLFCASLIGLAATGAWANDKFPSKPIKLVVPSQAGGLIDALARQIANAAQAHLGQPVLIDNRPGATGNIGTELVAKAPADGYTLLATLENGMASNAALFTKLPFDPQRDFRAVSAMATSQAAWVVRSSLPVNTLAEFGAYVKANPGKLTVATWGPGSSPHVVQGVLAKNFGMNLLPVPYKGEAPVMTALLGGEVDFVTTSPMLAQQNLSTGKFKVLAVSGPKRSPVFPDVPTVTEAGLKHDAFSRAGAVTIFAPKNTPPEVMAVLGQAFAAAAQDAKPQAFMKASGLVPVGSLPKQAQHDFDEYFAAQKRLVQATGIVLD